MTGSPFPIVGVGASAGGLEALTRLFSTLSRETGMGFVVVVHLDPRHDSALPGLLERSTGMTVVQATNGMTVEPDRIHVVPPNRTLEIADGRLVLGQRLAPHMPIDAFLRSLAAERGSAAIAVVLSGAGSDGALGLTEIKAAGGITLAQDESADYRSMPEQAIATGAVDLVGSPERIAEELGRIASHPYLAGAPSPPDPDDAPEREAQAGILLLLHERTGIDFSQYKPGTVGRRIQRRMALHRLLRPEEYLELLGRKPEEVAALFEDMLIQVTGFFRDPGTFAALHSKVYREILDERPAGEAIRVWVPGCATGEEAYSIAISLVEFLGPDDRPIRIFATDINEHSIETARRGHYLGNIVADVSEERLRRFFKATGHGFQIEQSIRDLCIFARQDLTSDPPFSQIDLISCRNVLIYFGAGLQQSVLPIFHYALRPGGFLVLGTSETIGQIPDRFSAFDQAHRIYRRRAGGTRLPVPMAPSAPRSTPTERNRPPAPGEVDFLRATDRLVAGLYGPPGVLIDRTMAVVQFRGETGRFLRPAPGAASHDVLRMCRQGLLHDLRTAVEEAFRTEKTVRRPGVGVRTNDHVTEVEIVVVPLEPRPAQRAVVLFEEAAAGGVDGGWFGRFLGLGRHRGGPAGERRDPADDRTAALEDDLAETRRYLQSIIEESDAGNEELRAANEEILSSNEELQSTNEELETAKEELQATNEELNTVNEELKLRNAELGQLNDDLQNLLASVDLPIVMLDRELRVRRFTPRAGRAFGLIAGDIGRPLRDLRASLRDVDLPDLARSVIDDLDPFEREVLDTNDRWHTLYLKPYRTGDHRIDGAVITLVGIDALKRSEARAESERRRAQQIAQSASEPLVVLDEQFVVEEVNRAFVEHFGISPAEAKGRPLVSLRGEAFDLPPLLEILAGVSLRGEDLRWLEASVHFPDLGNRTIRFTARPLSDRETGPRPVLLAVSDLTEQREAEIRNVASERLAAIGQMAATMAHESGNALQRNDGALERIGLRLSDLPELAPRLPEFESLLEQAREANRYLRHLFEEIQTYAGPIHVESRSTDIAELLGRAWNDLAPLRAGRDARLEVEASGVDVGACIDPRLGYQVLLNILTNALKFCPDPLVVRASLSEKRLAGGSPALGLSIADDGPGLSPESRRRLFEAFYTTQAQGTGLGLAISRRIVEGHGGSIAVGDPPFGTEIRIVLPRSEEDPT